jgi:DNA-binding response OmpR family regulator
MIGEALQKALRLSGYSVDWIEDGVSAEEAALAQPYDLMLLDIGLPGKSGIDVLKNLRARKIGCPVLILTARDAVSERVTGLDSGADDYMLKPFALEELEARIRSLLRRQAGHSDSWLRHGALSLNLKTHEVLFRGGRISLSGREFALLYALIKKPGAVLSRAQLEEGIYGWNEEVGSNAVEVHIHQLRKKIDPDIIRTIRNLGYMLAEIA